MESLDAAMKRFGDLGGVVFNVRSGHAVTAHKRVKTFSPGATIERLIEQEPDAQGTVALGFVNVDGERWSYREVSWDPETEMAANLAANRFAAEWDPVGVRSMLEQLQGVGFELALTGFTSEDFGWLLEAGEATAPKGEGDALPTPEPINLKSGAIKMVWVLVGVPIPLYGLVAEKVQDLGNVAGIFIETTVNNTQPK